MPDSDGLEEFFVRLYFDRHIMTRLAVDLRGRGADSPATFLFLSLHVRLPSFRCGGADGILQPLLFQALIRSRNHGHYY